MNFRGVVFVLALVSALLAACAPAPERPDRERPAPRAELKRAEQLAEAGSYEEAALYYMAAAEDADPRQGDLYRLRAADLLIQGRSFPRAGEALELIRRPALEGRDAVWFDLMAARVALERAAPAESLALLAGLEGRVPPEWQLRYRRLRAQALQADRRAFAAARERQEMSEMLTDPDLVRDNREALFSALLQLDAETMRQRLEALPEGDVMRGWLALAYEVKTRLFEGEPMDEALARWRAEYPGHPASERLAADLVARYREAFRYPDQIALLLPMTGRFAEAAKAIRNGFFAAYYSDEGRRSGIRIYDVEGHPQGVVGAYRQAVNDGAGWVVGPLGKDSVEMLLSQPAMPVPVLALNYADGPIPEARRRPPALQERPAGSGSVENRPADTAAVTPAVPTAAAPDAPAFQFGLLPEHEARQVAEKLMADGHRRALALTPADEWGRRMMQAFSQRYTELGGYLADTATFLPGEADHSGTIRDLLALADGQRRKQAVERLVGSELEYVPHARTDADALFLAAHPEQARLIRPQLRFFQAVNLPVYGSSHLYSGGPSPGNDSDLNGVIFCDAPWMLAGEGMTPPRPLVADRFPGAGGGLGRLYALGADAYRLIPYLPWLADHPGDEYNGLSGSLLLDQDNRIHRRLAWGRFEGGAPVPVARPLPAGSLAGSRR